MSTHYGWITDDMFDNKLNEILTKEIFPCPVNNSLGQEVWENTVPKNLLRKIQSIAPSAYIEIKEHYNSEVLEELEEERPPMTAQEFFDGDLEGCPICHDHRTKLEEMEIKKEKNIVSITYTCLECDEEFVFKMECKPIKIEH